MSNNQYTEEKLNIALNSVFKLVQTEVMQCMDIQLQSCLNEFEKETQTNIKLLPPVLNVWRQDNLISFFNGINLKPQRSAKLGTDSKRKLCCASNG